MEYTKEIDFEDALVKVLTEKYGWKDGVLNHPTEADLLKNWAEILYANNRHVDRLGNYPLTKGEIDSLVDQIKTLKTPLKLNGFVNGRTVGLKRDNPDDAAHFGKAVSLDIFDRMAIAGGPTRYQIARQPVLPTPNPLAPDRRGDVMLLINGLPLIHIELKRSGVAVGQATNQIEKYMHEGAFGGFFSLVQVFVAMNPTETVYFANPGQEGVFNRDYFFHWTDFNNVRVNEWDRIAEMLLSIPMAHQLIGFYSVADTADGVLKVMRPYQFYATRQIFEKVRKNDEWEGGKARLGGYVWHTTGSGKTLTCFKAAQLISETGSADKVVFLLDRRELGTQSLRDYRGFAGEDLNDQNIEEMSSVQATASTAALVAKLKSPDDECRLIVTSIQKMGRVKDEAGGKFLADIQKLRDKRIVFIVDEAHRDVTGDMLLNIKAAFPEAMFFGFTGTPILKGGPDQRTATIFGNELHRYTIAHGINDKNVLGFDPRKILTYRDIDLRRAVALEKVHAATEADALADEDKRETYLKVMNAGQTPMTAIEAALPTGQYDRDEHRRAVVKDIVDNWPVLSVAVKFHAILATASIPEAVAYYHLLKGEHPELKVAALFDPSDGNGDWAIAKGDALIEILGDYNAHYGTSFIVPMWEAYKRDVASRLAHKDAYMGISHDPAKCLDILIVVDQMLTGFDSKWLNTLYLDKMRDGENLIQAFSRTNWLFGPDKPFGSIRYYRKPHTMQKNIEDAIALYSGDRPFALYVDQLEQNLTGMNAAYGEIKVLFDSAGVKDFEKLPDDMAERGKVAELFKRLNDYLAAAKIQGFVWKESVYRFKHEESEDTLVTMIFDERVYGILAMRYKELATKGPIRPGGSPDVPFDIDPYLTEIDVGQINADYMNTKFQKFVKCLSQENVTPSELDAVREELHKTFASLPAEDQKYAEMLLDDLGSGNIQLEGGLTVQDYITQYKTRALNRDIDLCVTAFGLDKRLLVDILRSGHVTPGNLDEYGRFKKLMGSVDKEKAKAYLEAASGTPLSQLSYSSKITSVLSEFLYSGGKGEKIPKVVPHPEILSEIGEELKYNGWLPVYGFAAACGKFGAEEAVECDGWIDVSAAGVGHLTDKMYVVQAKGLSMEPQIADGQYCVFEYREGAFDPNDIVLAQHTPVQDDETQGAYSIKKIVVERRESEEAETPQNVSIVLRPLNRDPKYEAIVLPDLGEFGNDYKIVGVLRKVL